MLLYVRKWAFNKKANREGERYTFHNPVERVVFMIFDNVEFKPIPNWDGYYVDKNGRILSFMVIGSKTRREDFNNPRFLKPRLNSAGYPSISMFKNGKRKVLILHHIVAELFIGERPKNMVIDHIDGNRENCAVENLRYITQGENVMRSKVRSRYTNGLAYNINIKFNDKKYNFKSWNETIKALQLKKFSINTLKYKSDYGNILPVENKDYRLTKYNQSQETIEIELYSLRE